MSTNEEKFKAIHDWICTEITYDLDDLTYNGYPYHALGNPYTVYKNKKAVCYGFANLTSLMCQHAGIPCVVLRGSAVYNSAGSTASHVWNAVYLNDKWTFTDNTFDNNLTTNDAISYNYYLMTDDTYSTTYRTYYIENWAGDACYYPTCVSLNYETYSINIDPTIGGTVKVDKIPYNASMSKVLLPKSERSFFTFMRYLFGDYKISYENYGGVLLNNS